MSCPTKQDYELLDRLTQYFSGERRAVNFLQAFAATQFTVPTLEVIEWLQTSDDRRHPNPSVALTFMILTEYFEDEDTTLRFMRHFAGETVVLPTWRAAERIARERQIIRALERDPETPCVRRLARLHGVESRDVAKTYSRKQGRGLMAVRAERAAT